jgi:hypothetical protein
VAIYGEGLGRSEARTASDALEFFGRRPGWMRDGLCREHPNSTDELLQIMEAGELVCPTRRADPLVTRFCFVPRVAT